MAMAPALLPLLLIAVVVPANAQPPNADGDADAIADGNISFRPSVAIIVAIFSVMFSLTFLLLMYVKFCHNGGFTNRPMGDGAFIPAASTGSAAARTSSGIDKAVIDSLPFFLFSSLRGCRDGLECVVCLSRFNDAELLRLLPKCKHAFHAGCVDRWLESHSTCPLCRCRIDPGDPALFNRSSRRSTSSRFFFRDDHESHDDSTSASVLELFVEREPDKLQAKEVVEELLVDNRSFLHKHKHKIVLSGPGLKSRWSDLNSSDLVSLDVNSMLSSSNRYFANSAPVEGAETTSIKEELGKKRCMSEMTSVSRFRASGGGSEEEEEKVRRVWLPIARRTVRWFAGRERRPEQSEKNTNKVELTIVSEVSN